MVNFKPGNIAPFKHGAYHYLCSKSMPCSNCINRSDCTDYEENGTCRPLEQWSAQLVNELMADNQHLKAIDVHLVDELVSDLCFMKIIKMWLSRVGLIADKNHGSNDIDLRSVLKSYFLIQNSARRLAHELILTPLARRELNYNPKNFMDLAIEVNNEEAKQDN